MSMNIADLERYAASFWKPYHTICLSSNHGIGKSSVIKNNLRKVLAKKHKVKLEDVIVIDKRASQLDPGDLIGSSFMVGGQTFNAPPSWIPVHPDDGAWLKERLEKAEREWVPFMQVEGKIYVMFFDEVIRGQPATLQALFEAILDHSVHGIRFPDNCYVACAINGNGALYNSSRQDPAWTDRLLMIEFFPTKKEFLGFMSDEAKEGRIHKAIPAYLYKYQDNIDPDDELIEQNAMENKKGHSRRSWYRWGEALMEGISNLDDLIADVLDHKAGAVEYLEKAATAHVGDAMGQAFAAWVNDEYKSLDVETILNDFSEETRAAIMDMAESNGVSLGGVSEAIVKRLSEYPNAKLPENINQNILKYVQCLPRENVNGFWSLWGKGKTSAQAIAWNKTPARQLVLLSASASGTDTIENWKKTMLKKNPNIVWDSDEYF
jgi:hypothetical protein